MAAETDILYTAVDRGRLIGCAYRLPVWNINFLGRYFWKKIPVENRTFFAAPWSTSSIPSKLRIRTKAILIQYFFAKHEIGGIRLLPQWNPTKSSHLLLGLLPPWTPPTRQSQVSSLWFWTGQICRPSNGRVTGLRMPPSWKSDWWLENPKLQRWDRRWIQAGLQSSPTYSWRLSSFLKMQTGTELLTTYVVLVLKISIPSVFTLFRYSRKLADTFFLWCSHSMPVTGNR